MQRQALKGKKPAVDDDFVKQTSTSHVANQSDSDTQKPIGSSMENTTKKLSIETSDDEISFQTKKSEEYRIIDLKNLSKVVSSACV